MKKFTISVLALSTAIILNSCATKTSSNGQDSQVTKSTSVKDEGINLSYMDTSVKPQDDFYDFVNGGWMKTAVIPSDKASWGSFNGLREEVDVASLGILNKILSEKYSPNSEGEKIQALYGTFMDWKTRNTQGINPIQADIDKINKLNSISDLQNYLLEATKKGDNPFYNWYASADMKNSVMNAVYLGGPALGLGKDYYQKVNDANTKTLAEYQKYVSSMMSELGDKYADQTAQRIVAFEKQLAGNLLTLEQGRDANLRYNPKTMAELSTLVTHINY
jgi:putative endopeptidase